MTLDNTYIKKIHLACQIHLIQITRLLSVACGQNGCNSFSVGKYVACSATCGLNGCGRLLPIHSKQATVCTHCTPSTPVLLGIVWVSETMDKSGDLELEESSKLEGEPRER